MGEDTGKPAVMRWRGGDDGVAGRDQLTDGQVETVLWNGLDRLGMRGSARQTSEQEHQEHSPAGIPADRDTNRASSLHMYVPVSHGT